MRGPTVQPSSVLCPTYAAAPRERCCEIANGAFRPLVVCRMAKDFIASAQARYRCASRRPRSGFVQMLGENGAARLLTAHFDRLLSAAWQRTSSRQHKPATDVHPDVLVAGLCRCWARTVLRDC